MELTAREDIEAPLDAVFRAISDFEGFERAILRRGADVVRLDALTAPGVGMCWEVAFEYRKKRRKARVELVAFDRTGGLTMRGISAGVQADFEVALVALSRARTRMDVTATLTPTTLPGRLLLQPLKLAHATMTRRFRQRVAEFAGKVEDSYRKAALA